MAGIAAIAFVAMFVVFVILPTFLMKRKEGLMAVEEPAE